MKTYIILIISALLPSLFSFAQPCEITGKVLTGVKTGNDIVGLFTVVDGSTKLKVSVKLADDSSFSFLFDPPYEGLYSVGIADVNRGERVMDIYVKKGSKIQILIDTIAARFDGKLSSENTLLADWSKIIAQLRSKAAYDIRTSTGSSCQDFFSTLQVTAKKAQGYANSIHIANVEFSGQMKDLIRFETDYYALSFLKTCKDLPSKDNYPDYYKTIVVKNKFANNNVLALSSGVKFMTCYVDYAAGNDSASLDDKLVHLTTDQQKGAYLFNNVVIYVRTFTKYEEMMEKYGKYFQSTGQKTFISNLRDQLVEVKPGSKASEFKYSDANGKIVSLADFKGKVVLLDVWATWCGPCRAEFPSLKKLEEQYKDSAVVFISVSLDQEKDKEKWLKMIKDENMGGIQIFAGNESKIAKDYNCRTIPRFIVIDKKGVVANPDSPRPSDGSQLNGLLDYVLNDYKKQTPNDSAIKNAK